MSRSPGLALSSVLGQSRARASAALTYQVTAEKEKETIWSKTLTKAQSAGRGSASGMDAS